MYPYHNPYEYQEFLGTLIQVTIVFAIAVGIGFLLRFIITSASRPRRAEREEYSVGDYIGFILKLIFVKLPLFIYRLCSKQPSDNSRMPRKDLHFEDKEKESNKGMDEYHV